MNILKKIQWQFENVSLAFVNAFQSLVYYKTLKVYLCNHLTVGISYLRKQETRFPHPVGIVIGQKVKLGKKCTIYQNVTIGTKETRNFETAAYPVIGNGVTIFANSIIFGDITIGDGSVIGAGSIVFQNIPPNSIVAGNPARIVSKMPQVN